MRHKKKFRKFGREGSHRTAMFRNLAASLITHERIVTTVAKAKDLRTVVEPLITKAGEDTLHNRRAAMSYIYDKAVVHKLYADVGPRFKDRQGGYTRIIKIARRTGDAAEMAIIELVDSKMVEAKIADEVETAPAAESKE